MCWEEHCITFIWSAENGLSNPIEPNLAKAAPVGDTKGAGYVLPSLGDDKKSEVTYASIECFDTFRTTDPIEQAG